MFKKAYHLFSCVVTFLSHMEDKIMEKTKYYATYFYKKYEPNHKINSMLKKGEYIVSVEESFYKENNHVIIESERFILSSGRVIEL